MSKVKEKTEDGLVKTETIIDESNYTQLKALLDSTNESDQVLGIMTIENCEFKKSLGYIMMLYKSTFLNNAYRLDTKLWKENAPKLSKKLETLVKPYVAKFKSGNNLTLNEISEVVAKTSTLEQLQVVCNEGWRSQLLTQLRDNFNMTSLKDITITLKTKEDYEQGNDTGKSGKGK